MKNPKVRQVVLPLITAMIWGSSFVTQSLSAGHLLSLIHISQLDPTLDELGDIKTDDINAVADPCLLYTSIRCSVPRSVHVLTAEVRRISSSGAFPQRRRSACRPVSYTHLDVYKRQRVFRQRAEGRRGVLVDARQDRAGDEDRRADGGGPVSYTHLK